jgi:hypothetical protein
MHAPHHDACSEDATNPIQEVSKSGQHVSPHRNVMPADRKPMPPEFKLRLASVF